MLQRDEEIIRDRQEKGEQVDRIDLRNSSKIKAFQLRSITLSQFLAIVVRKNKPGQNKEEAHP